MADRTVVEEVEFAKRYSDGTILLKHLRFSYPNVFEARAMQEGQAKTFNVIGMMPKATHKAARSMLLRVIKSILKENNKGEPIPAKMKFIKDGDPPPKTDDDEDDVPEGKAEYVGMWLISARERNRPTVLSNRKDPKTGKLRRLSHDNPNDVAMIYGGCWGNILIRPWWQNNEYGKRVNAGLSVVQFVKDDEPFGSGRITDDDIDDTMEEEAEIESDEDDEEGL